MFFKVSEQDILIGKVFCNDVVVPNGSCDNHPKSR